MKEDRSPSVWAGALILFGMLAGAMSVVPSVESPGYLISASANHHDVFRGTLFQLLMAPAYVGFALLLYPRLRQLEPALALGFVGLRFVAAAFVILAASILPLFVVLSEAFVQAGAPEQSHYQTIGELMRQGRDLINHVAMIVSVSLSGIFLYALLYRQLLVPPWLALWGMTSANLAIAASLLVLLGVLPVISVTYLALNTPMALQELLLAALLIAKGLHSPPERHEEEPVHAQRIHE